jgi:hypothetical protein
MAKSKENAVRLPRPDTAHTVDCSEMIGIDSVTHTERQADDQG